MFVTAKEHFRTRVIPVALGLAVLIGISLNGAAWASDGSPPPSEPTPTPIGEQSTVNSDPATSDQVTIDIREPGSTPENPLAPQAKDADR